MAQKRAGWLLVREHVQMTGFCILACTSLHSSVIIGFVNGTMWDACPNVSKAVFQVVDVSSCSSWTVLWLWCTMTTACSSHFK